MSEYLGHIGTNGSSYLRRNYEWVDNVTKREKLEVLDGAGLLDTPESFNSMSVTTSDTATFVHNGYKLLEANYDSGFSQKFEYDSNANLVKVTSSGTPSVDGIELTTNCAIEYARMIGKRDQKPLNFLVLPGKELYGTFHECVEVRGITLVGMMSTNSPFTQDFAGKFWWDAENIINAQAQAAREETTSTSTNNTQSSQQDNTAINEAQLKNAYNAKIGEYAKYQGQKISGTITEVEGVNKMALSDFGSDISYALFDLNGDGTDELLIGCGTDSTIADAFTFENGQVKRILFSWARSYYEMCENGYLKYHGSNGANSFVDKICKFEGPFTYTETSDYSSDALAAPKTILKLELDRTTKSTSPYYFTGEDGNAKAISDAEAKTKRNEFDSYVVVTINWIPVTQGL